MGFFGNFFGGALIDSVTWWLENDQPYDVEAMVENFQQMFIHGALYSIIIEPSQETELN